MRLNVQVDIHVSPELALSAPFGSDVESRVNRIYKDFLAEKRMEDRSKILFEFGVSVAPMGKEAHRAPGQSWAGTTIMHLDS